MLRVSGAVGPPSPGLVVFSLWLVMLVTASQTLIVVLILPLIGRSLGIGDTALGSLVAAYALSMGAFALVGGTVSDRVGRKHVLAWGAVLMTAALLAHGITVGYSSFLAVRVLAGAAAGLLVGAAQAYVGDYFPYERRGWAAGWVMSGVAAGQVLGIPGGVLLAGELGFEAPFYLFGAVMCVASGLIMLRLPEVKVARSGELFSVAAALRSYGDVLVGGSRAATLLASSLMMLGQALFVVYLPTWLERSFGAGPGVLARLFLLGGAVSVLVGPRAGALSDRIGRREMIAWASLGLAVLMGCTTVVVREIWVVYPLFMVAMALVAMRLSPLTALLTGLVDGARRGALMNLNVALGQIAFGLGSAASGWLFAFRGYVANTLTGATCLLLMAVVVWRFVPEPAAGRIDTGTSPSRSSE